MLGGVCIEISGVSDFDILTEPGRFLINSAANANNSPIGTDIDTGGLIVEKLGGNRLKQTYTSFFRQINNTLTRIRENNGNWSSWKLL